ncbi:MAG: DnaJ C-terminal domain-containing protein [Armatimonadota bacterium]|nr:DnaJ C-terminal domain-containing protein [Armatimonadota bacterium]MDR7563275.1 DnaJ C-terminal domain-containing protein [Armatimonadota bacterium]MDR7602062.1 DnaJ C-terminal domain-containing protein [Armatimonadota bacterium]
MEFKDYYRILGIPRNADAKQINEAFRRLARQYHPDVNKDPQAAEKFKEINEAYQVLSDPEKRKRYDQMLELRERGIPWDQVFTGPRAEGPGEWTILFGEPGEVFERFEDFGFSEFFRRFFGDLGIHDPFARAGRRRFPFGFTRTVPREDVTTSVEISLLEAFHGTERELSLSLDGRSRRIRVQIPPGIRDGQKVRVRGVVDGADLYVEVRVRPHPLFSREGDDLVCELPISLTEALLGAEIEVPTLSGKVKMRIPPETQNGQVFRLRGQGMPRLVGSGRGDLLVRVKVVLPQRLSPEERRLIEELSRLRQENPRAAMGLR